MPSVVNLCLLVFLMLPSLLSINAFQTISFFFRNLIFSNFLFFARAYSLKCFKLFFFYFFLVTSIWFVHTLIGFSRAQAHAHRQRKACLFRKPQNFVSSVTTKRQKGSLTWKRFRALPEKFPIGYWLSQQFI